MLESSLKELPNLMIVLSNATIAVGRLEAFMNEADKEEGDYSNAEIENLDRNNCMSKAKS
ncbi:hypothetical protein F4811DRAFT_533204 [Daldinia bambusicola]|nr:hypothetical protein F4811DRAFT_533204 [Daldinia bambusicola]